jgi:hypothetical protein
MLSSLHVEWLAATLGVLTLCRQARPTAWDSPMFLVYSGDERV